MTSIRERRQQLDFDSSWRVAKWDESDEFAGSMEKTLHQLSDGIKAVDVVGVREQLRRPRTLLLAEFKDFDHPNVPSSQRANVALQAVSDTLVRDLVRKIIDSLAGATFAHDSSSNRCAEIEGWRPALARSSTSLLILFCIEVPATQAVAALAWTKNLQRRLRWLGPNARVIVTTSARPFQGDGVTYRLS